eukprot:747667-Heterocapsa_arctica.AAC.1
MLLDPVAMLLDAAALLLDAAAMLLDAAAVLLDAAAVFCFGGRWPPDAAMRQDAPAGPDGGMLLL